MYQQPFYAGARIVLTYPVQNGIRRLGDFRRGAQVQHDTVYIGFVGDVGRSQLHRYGVADLFCSQCGLDGIGNDPGREG